VEVNDEVGQDESLARPGIYAITHVASGKQYIGQSVNISQRWAQHRFELRRNHHKSRHLQHAWNKYGADAFSFTVLEYVEPGDDLIVRLTEREQFHMDASFSEQGSRGYNYVPAGGSNLGYRHSPETREHMREAARKRASSPETLEKIRAAAQNRPAYWHVNQSTSHRGTKWSEARRAAWEANRGRGLSEAQQRLIERWRAGGLAATRSGVRTPKQLEALHRLHQSRRGSHLSETVEQKEVRLRGLRRYGAERKTVANERREAILRSFAAITEQHGETLSIFRRVQLVATEHGISDAMVYGVLRAYYPGLIVSSVEKGKTTRQRMLDAVRDFETQGGQPQHISLTELARIVAPTVGLTPEGAVDIIRRMRQEGVLPPTDCISQSLARLAGIEQTYTFLQRWFLDTSDAPSSADIANALGISRDSARRYTKHLINEGRIDRHYRPIEQNHAPAQLPLFLD